MTSTTSLVELLLRERNLITAAVQDELQGELDARLQTVESGIAASQRAKPRRVG